MRTLTLMRHAKSDWPTAVPGSAPVPDKQRPLSLRGVRAAPRMGAWMGTAHIQPDLILCSTAVRTRQTLALVSQHIAGEKQIIEMRNELYLGDYAELFKLVRATPDHAGHVMLLGHNPGLHDLALKLIGAGNIETRRALAIKFPTAGVVVIDFAFDSWRSLGVGTGTLRHFMAPKQLATSEIDAG
jgi:phosphohistidine phosphatase